MEKFSEKHKTKITVYSRVRTHCPERQWWVRTVAGALCRGRRGGQEKSGSVKEGGEQRMEKSLGPGWQ